MKNKKKKVLKRNIKLSCAATNIEEKLFHGTNHNSLQAICRDGFNRTYCGKNGTMYGQGLYFSREAIYSHSYSKSGLDNNQFSRIVIKGI